MPFGRFIPVSPPPPNTNLTGKSAIVTGASSGIGRETARQLLTMHISTLILAVRNVNKGEDARTSCCNSNMCTGLTSNNR